MLRISKLILLISCSPFPPMSFIGSSFAGRISDPYFDMLNHFVSLITYDIRRQTLVQFSGDGLRPSAVS